MSGDFEGVHDRGAGVREGRYKLVSADGSAETSGWLIQNEHTDPGDGVHLYDIVDDPSETTDLSHTLPATLADVLTKHIEWREKSQRPSCSARRPGLPRVVSSAFAGDSHSVGQRERLTPFMVKRALCINKVQAGPTRIH